MPDDSMLTRLKDLRCGDKEPELIIGYFDVEKNIRPEAKSYQTYALKYFQVGDIVDVIVKPYLIKCYIIIEIEIILILLIYHCKIRRMLKTIGMRP